MKWALCAMFIHNINAIFFYYARDQVVQYVQNYTSGLYNEVKETDEPSESINVGDPMDIDEDNVDACVGAAGERRNLHPVIAVHNASGGNNDGVVSLSGCSQLRGEGASGGAQAKLGP